MIVRDTFRIRCDVDETASFADRRRAGIHSLGGLPEVAVGGMRVRQHDVGATGQLYSVDAVRQLATFAMRRHDISSEAPDNPAGGVRYLIHDVSETGEPSGLLHAQTHWVLRVAITVSDMSSDACH